MSLTKKDVELFTKSFQCFSKLLILYPMIHPATIHGLLVEFNYDYGFVMQMILKLEKQRNALYWDEVARVSRRMEAQNRTRMNFYKDINIANQRLSDMMDNQISSAINTYNPPANNNMPICPLMEDSTSSLNETSSVVSDLLENANFLHKISEMDLNEIMQMATEPQIVHQQANVNANPPKNIPAPNFNLDEEMRLPIFPSPTNSNTFTPFQANSSISTPYQANSSMFYPFQANSSIYTPLQANSSIYTPLQANSSIYTPFQANSSISSSFQTNSSISTPFQANSSISTSFHTNSSISCPFQANSSISTPFQASSSMSTHLNAIPITATPFKARPITSTRNKAKPIMPPLIRVNPSTGAPYKAIPIIPKPLKLNSSAATPFNVNPIIPTSLKVNSNTDSPFKANSNITTPFMTDTNIATPFTTNFNIATPYTTYSNNTTPYTTNSNITTPYTTNSNSATTLKKGPVILDSKVDPPTKKPDWDHSKIAKAPQISLLPNNTISKSPKSQNKRPVILENRIYKPRPPKPIRTSWHITEIPGNITRVVHTYSTPTPEQQRQQEETLVTKPSPSFSWGMHDYIEFCHKPKVQNDSKPNNNNPVVPKVPENQMSLVKYSPETTTKANAEEAMAPQPSSSNNRVTDASNSNEASSSFKWPYPVVDQEADVPQNLTTGRKKSITEELREYRKPKKILPKVPDTETSTKPVLNQNNQAIVETSATDIYINHLREILPITPSGIINVQTTRKTTKWKIVGVKAPANFLSTKPKPLQPLNTNTYQLIKIPNLQNTTLNFNSNTNGMSNEPNALLGTNNENWQINEITEHPKIQMVLSRSNSTENLSSDEILETQANEPIPLNTKTAPKKRVRKQKLKVNKTIADPQTNKLTEMDGEKPVKRRNKNDNSNSPNKKARLETSSLSSEIEEVKQDVKETNISDDVPIKEEPLVEVPKKKAQKRKRGTPRLTPKKKKPQKKNPDLRNNDENKEKSKPKKQSQPLAKPKKNNKTVKEQRVLEVPKAPSKKNANRKPQINRNKRRTRNTSTESEEYIHDVTTGTDFLRVDPHCTRIEDIPEGQLITVCPRPRNIKGLPDLPEVQFIRRYPNRYSKSKKSDYEKMKIKKEEIKFEVSDNSEKPKSQKSKQTSKRQTPKSNAPIYTPPRKTARSKNGKGNKNPDKNSPPKKPTKQTKKALKVPKGSVLCCCQSIAFRKKYRLPPFDTEEGYALYPDELLFPKEDETPSYDSVDSSDDSEEEIQIPLFKEVNKRIKGKNKKFNSKKKNVKRLYNTRSSKGKKENIVKKGKKGSKKN